MLAAAQIPTYGPQGLRNQTSSPAAPGTQLPGGGAGAPPPATAPAPPPHAGPPGPAPAGMQWTGGGQWRPWRLVPIASSPASPAAPVPGVPGGPQRQPTPPGAGPSGPFMPAQPSGPPPMRPGPGMPGQPPPGAQPPGPGNTPSPGAYNDPYSALLASVPLMQQQMTQNIAGAEAQAGFTGNRFGTYGANAAAQAGAQTSMAMNEQLLQAMLNQGQNDQHNALTAAGLGLQGENLSNQEQMNQLMMPFQIGQYEQNRQDQFSNTAFQDWSQNRLGWLPLASQLAASQHPASYSPGQIYSTQTPGSPGALQYASGIAGLLGAFGL